MRQSLLSIVAASATVAAQAAPAAKAYDYIVVGSGPGGGPLAADLARAGYSTLLLEAGDDQLENPTYSELQNFLEAGSDGHSRWDFWIRHSSNDTHEREYEFYTYRTTDGGFYSGLDGLGPPAGAVPLGKHYPRAATLGGCAMHNAGVSSLAQDDDWNIIVNKTGDTSWEAPKMRKYLTRLENNQQVAKGTPGHGFDGRTCHTPPPPLFFSPLGSYS
jgi:choline dehydrogenase